MKIYTAQLAFTCGDNNCLGDLVPSDMMAMECDACGKLYYPTTDVFTWETEE